jgi:flagellar biosynthesis/type III secretory pathway protein FliH
MSRGFPFILQLFHSSNVGPSKAMSCNIDPGRNFQLSLQLQSKRDKEGRSRGRERVKKGEREGRREGREEGKKEGQHMQDKSL